MKRSVILVGVMVVACSMLLQAQAPIPNTSPIPNMSPIIGVWKVNVEESTYFPGPRPAAAAAAQVRRYVDRGHGVIAELRMNVSLAAAVAFAILSRRPDPSGTREGYASRSGYGNSL
jgi:hypothetical protein